MYLQNYGESHSFLVKCFEELRFWAGIPGRAILEFQEDWPMLDKFSVCFPGFDHFQ